MPAVDAATRPEGLTRQLWVSKERVPETCPMSVARQPALDEETDDIVTTRSYEF